MRTYVALILTLILLSSCSKHPSKNERYVDKNTRDIITVEGFGKGYDLLFSDTTIQVKYNVYNDEDSAKQCVSWIDSSDSELHRVIMSVQKFDSGYVVLSDKIKLHPRKDDWYENLETRERVKIDRVGNGKEVIESMFRLKKDIGDIIPMGVYISGDSAAVANSFSVVIHQSKVYGYIPISSYTIYQENKFEKNYKLIQ